MKEVVEEAAMKVGVEQAGACHGVTGEQRAEALAALAARADTHAAAARSARTHAAYAGDWAHFTRWCRLAGRVPPPTQALTMRLYLTDL